MERAIQQAAVEARPEETDCQPSPGHLEEYADERSYREGSLLSLTLPITSERVSYFIPRLQAQQSNHYVYSGSTPL